MAGHLHIYTGSDDYWTNVLQPHQAERAIRYTRALIERAAYRQKIATPPRIAYDEWNVWYRQMTGALEERYTFADALAVGTYLNIFVRNCDWVQIVTSPEAAAVQPIWYPILLHAQAALDLAVDTHVAGPLIEPELPAGASRWPFRIGDLGSFGLIDAAATVGANANGVNAHKIAVTLVNRGAEDELAEVQLRDRDFDGPATVRTVTAAAAGEARTLPDVEAARLEEGSESTKGGVRAGDRVTFAIDPARLYFFDPDTGQAIAADPTA